MLNKIEKILVVINETDKIGMLLKKAVTLNKEYHGVLEILFVHEAALFNVPDYFRESETGDINEKSIKQEIEKTLSSLEYTASYALFIETSDTVHQVLALDKSETGTLVLAAFNAKVTEKLAKKVSSPLLIIKSEDIKYKHILFPVDMNQNNEAYIKMMHTLFPSAEVHLLFEPSYVIENYVFDEDFVAIPLDPAIDIEFDHEMLEAQKKKFEVLKEKTGLTGEMINETDIDIIDYLNAQKPDLVVIHSENENFLFDDTISKDLLKSIKEDIIIL